MKMFLTLCLFFSTFTTLAIASEPVWGEVRVEQVDVQYSQQRPFSFYYPYPNQYYTPRQHHSSCYWTNVNGTYIYQCN
jgi:hypothetical protein